MPKTKEETAYYIRTRNGDTFYVDTLVEALDEFLGEGGYRLTLFGHEKELIIQRPAGWLPGVNTELETPAFLTYRKA